MKKLLLVLLLGGFLAACNGNKPSQESEAAAEEQTEMAADEQEMAADTTEMEMATDSLSEESVEADSTSEEM